MLTPEQIKTHKFRSAGKGLYRSDEVDAFFKDAAKTLKKTRENEAELQKSNDELYQRVEALANALNQMKAERELIQKTMITAQKSADELTEKARAESEKLAGDAKAQAETKLRDARREAETLQGNARREAEKLVLEAQAQAENLQAKARVKAEKLFEEARATAQEELMSISAQAQREQQSLTRLREESETLRGKLLGMLDQYKALIEESAVNNREDNESAEDDGLFDEPMVMPQDTDEAELEKEFAFD